MDKHTTANGFSILPPPRFPNEGVICFTFSTFYLLTELLNYIVIND